MNLRTPHVYHGTDATGDFGLILDTIDGDRADGVAILCGCGSADVVAVAPGDASSDGCDFADTPLGRIGSGNVRSAACNWMGFVGRSSANGGIYMSDSVETIISAPSHSVCIWVAGDPAEATRICRAFCMRNPPRVTVTPTDFVYTGGAEGGVCVRLVNYPRFPMAVEAIDAAAVALARDLRDGLSQWSAMVETPATTTWLTTRGAGNR